MKIESPAFRNGEYIPGKYSRYADDRSPPLNFADVPADTRSLALVMEDPDAPHGTFTHWVVFNIDPDAPGFVENTEPDDVKHGRNSWGEASYGGPRPPNGEHRYFFRLYALDQPLDLDDGVERANLEDAMTGHVLAEAELMGRYATPARVA